MVDSPCNKICQLNADDVCVGCGRERREIGAWTQLAEAEKRKVVERARARLEAVAGKKPAGPA